MGDHSDEAWSLVLRLGHRSRRHSRYRVAHVRCFPPTHQIPGKCSRPKHIGLRYGRLPGHGWPCNPVASQREDWRRCLCRRLLGLCGIVAGALLRRDSCAWLENRRLVRRLFWSRTTAMAGGSCSNRLRIHLLHGFSVAGQSRNRGALDDWIPPIIFGLGHLIGIRVFASIVPRWIPFGSFWAVLTGIAFLLAGVAICSRIKDVPAARLLALMLLLFEGLVEVPPIFVRLHDQATWGAAVYNLAAIGACWIFAEFLASRADR